MELEELLERQSLAIELAHRAGKIIKQACGNMKLVDEKCCFADLVTESDKAVEKMVFDEIKKRYPNDNFIGEESANDVDTWTSDPTWIIDPIDGTTNFVHNFPFCCISIGFTFNREPCLGVIYHPHMDHLYTAIKGQGAKLVKPGETVELRVRECPSLSQALVVAELGSQRDEAKRECVFRNLESIGWACHGIRSLGSAALNICSVAAGQLDAFFEFGPYIWDICAGVVLVKEAGGYVCDTTGAKLDMQGRRFIVASSEKLAKEIASKLVIQLDFNKT